MLLRSHGERSLTLNLDLGGKQAEYGTITVKYFSIDEALIGQEGPVCSNKYDCNRCNKQFTIPEKTSKISFIFSRDPSSNEYWMYLYRIYL